MNWKDILKVEDIEFDNSIRSEGYYATTAPRSIPLHHPETLEFLGMYDIPREEAIRINPKKIRRGLELKLGRKPTDREWEEAVKRVIMHEGAHAGHAGADFESFGRREGNRKQNPDHKTEMVANLLMFPESVYLGMKQMLSHPASVEPDGESRIGFNQETGLIDIFRGMKFTPSAKNLNDVILYVDRHATKMKDKEKLTRLEIASRKGMKFNKNQLPINLAQATARYGKEHRPFLSKLKW